MSDPLALLPLAIAAAGGRVGAFGSSQLVAAAFTLLQRCAPLVRALAGRRSAILLPIGHQWLVALAASDGRGALLLSPHAAVSAIAEQVRLANVGAVFTLESLRTLLPEGTPVVLLDDAPRVARVLLAGRDLTVDLGSHHGLALAGDTATDGCDDECLAVPRPSGALHVWTHRDLMAAARATVAGVRLTAADHVLTLGLGDDTELITAGFTAPLLAGASVSVLPPRHVADIAAAGQNVGASVVAARWHIGTGTNVSAQRIEVVAERLRDGTLRLADG